MSRTDSQVCRCRLLVLVLVGLLFTSCALSKHPRRIRHPAGTRAAPVTERAPGPERAASNSIIDKGRVSFEAGSFDRAGDLFREAIKVDPTNGAGYYWLAVVKARVGEYGEVWGLIDRAQSLLGSDPTWVERIEELKRDLETTKPD